MKDVSPKLSRCAVYTRKSTEHNLDLAFNSLDAQREACEAYIKSQAHEGWRLLRQPYDDGGLSGASLERPALQRLLTDVRARKIDIVVVYKVDRLTRSLADFAKLVEAFDAHGVSFVSVTQSFNTTSSMGRLTLNVLLSFAQFEREVIGERVRDKIAASKRKGIWVGGPVPLGYRVSGKKLIVVPEEAAVVRVIFERYLALGSIRMLADDLAARAISPRPRTGRDGATLAGTRFMVGPLAHILKNRCYIGEVAYHGEVYPGEQEPILNRNLFETVQTRLTEGAVRHERPRSPAGSASLLMGILFDGDGNRMSPSHANKKGVRYRYYVSQAVLQSGTPQTGAITRASAPEVEELVLAAARRRPNDGPDGTNELTDRELLAAYVQRIVLCPQWIEVTWRDPASASGQAEGPATLDQSSSVLDIDAPHSGSPPAQTNDVLLIPWVRTKTGARRGIASEPANRPMLDPRTRAALLLAIGKARAWVDDLANGRVASFSEIAEREGRVERHVRLLAPLAFVSPGIIAAIIDGSLPADVTVTSLARGLPHAWAQQERGLGIR